MQLGPEDLGEAGQHWMLSGQQVGLEDGRHKRHQSWQGDAGIRSLVGTPGAPLAMGARGGAGLWALDRLEGR